MTILAMILQGLLAAVFLMAGFGKIFGSKMHIEGFEKWKLPQWFRVVTGVIEFAIAVLLIVGFWNSTIAIIAAAAFVVVTIGGVITHLRVKDSFKDTAPIGVLGLLALGLLLILL